MIRRLSVLMLLALLTGLLAVPAAAQEDGPIRQWASSASATSQYTDDAWSAQQVLGPPDTKGCGDFGSAWASSTASGVDALTVYFETPVYPTQIRIYQTFNPGSISGIDLIGADGSILPIDGSADPGTSCPGAFTFDIGWDDVPLVQGLVIHVDQRRIGSWNEIDAVELVGYPGEFTGTTTNNNTTVTGYTYDGPAGISVTCDDGTTFSNGIQVIVVQMRSGYTYTATALGLNGFDPVLAVLDTQTGRGLCVDDDINAAAYSAWLPTTGQVNPSRVNSQITFANNSQYAFANVSLVVGGLNNSAGEFLLILEGMALTSADGDGDPFALQITPGMIASGIVPTTYMISISSRFDPLMALYDPERGYLMDSSKNYYACDDAGDAASCWGESYSMAGSYVSRTHGRQLGGGGLDAMLRLPVVAGQEWQYYNFMMRSARNTYGDYIVAFHMGIG